MKASHIKLGVVVLLLTGIAFAAFQVLYAGPRDKLLAELERHQKAATGYETALKARTEVRAGLKAIAESTLGANKDEVISRFRTSLHSVASECGLSGITVNTLEPQGVENPIAKARLTSGYAAFKNEMKKEPDFSAIPGELSGQGSLEQVLRAVAMLRQQPWVHRVQHFSIKPEDKERTRFSLKIGVTTMLLPPSQAPKDRGEPVVLQLADSAKDEWATVLRKNVFRDPPPPPPAVARNQQQPPPAAPRPPARPAYDDWKLTGVVQSRLGIEAFLVNTKSGQTMTLPTGSSVADARFVSGSGERAVFEIEGEQFEIINGQTLEQRRPVTR